MSTEHHYSPDELVERLPGFLDSLFEIEEYDVAAARSLASEHALVHAARRRDYGRDLRLLHAGDNPTALSRRLRTAVNKKIGKPTGTVGEYSSGPFRFTIYVDDEAVEIKFIYAQHRLDMLAEAASAWLAGETLDEWTHGAGYRFVHSPTDEQGRPTDTRNLGVYINASDDGGMGSDADGIYISISLPVEAGAHPRGVFGNTKEERYEVVRTYLVDELGDQEGSHFTGMYWRNGRRWVVLRGFRSSSAMELALTHGSETLLIPKQRLDCGRCGATWVGHEGDPCPTCATPEGATEPAPDRPRSPLRRLFGRGK